MKRRLLAIALILAVLGSMLVSACGADSTNEKDLPTTAYALMEEVNTQELNILDDNYRNFYEIFPYSFCDSNGDGIGDLNGITEKLDYLDGLGINGIWMTPIFSSTTYHKYDIVDYYSIDPDFGTIEDFDNLMQECNARGINVILDLVVNHTSSSHPWFKEAYQYLQSLDADAEPSVEDCAYFEYYNFSKEYKSGWTQVSGTDWYYESQFWSEMPDLNLDSQAVRDEIDDIVSFWMDRGISGFRLDATTSYYTGNDEKNIEFLTWLNNCVKGYKEDAYIVGEAWTYSVSYGKYYQSGVDSFFDFDFATKTGTITKTLQVASALSFGNAVVAMHELLAENNEEYIDAAFTSNHDTARCAGNFAGDNAQSMTKMAQAMAMMMGGNYFLYYGDELGMKGTGDDENKRVPMLWSSDENAEGMCRSIATKDIEMKYGSLEEQLEDSNSIYYFVQEGLKLRNMYPEIARGETAIITELSNEKILVMQKEYQDSQLVIIMNLSEEEMTVDLSGISINGKGAGEFAIAGTLLTGDVPVTVDDAVVTMPAYSVELIN